MCERRSSDLLVRTKQETNASEFANAHQPCISAFRQEKVTMGDCGFACSEVDLCAAMREWREDRLCDGT